MMKVFIEDGCVVVVGLGEVGLVVVGGNVLFGYYKDVEKLVCTFKVIDG